MTPEFEAEIRELLRRDDEDELDLDEMTLNGEWPGVLGMLDAAMESIDVLRAEVERLKAAPVVVPELRGLTDEQAQAIADTFAIETTKYTVFRIWAIAQDQVACDRAESASRLRTIGPGEVVVDAAELAGLRAFADGWSSFRDQFNDIPYHYQGMGCGIEDRGIHDRYAACEYGWECAMERVAERFPEIDTLEAIRAQATTNEGGDA